MIKTNSFRMKPSRKKRPRIGRRRPRGDRARSPSSPSSSAAETRPVPPDHAAKMQEGLALFKEHVRPVLVQHCLDCHGGKATKGDFDLSDRKPLIESGMIEGGGKASQLSPDHPRRRAAHAPRSRSSRTRHRRRSPAGSTWALLRPAARRPGAKRSPPGRRPTDEAPQLLVVPAAGRSSPPAVSATMRLGPHARSIASSSPSSTPRGSKPNPPADRATLIRRVSFDLIGLPPTPEEVDAFVADARPDAYERLVDRLLASPHFGERWARHWMDVARFAESHGYEQDYDRPFAYHYRDFLIRAFNGDMPYDQFVRWQLAGDELAPDDPLAMAATGFLGAGAFPTQLTEAEFESARYNELDDMDATTGTAFLGLSVGCAAATTTSIDPIPSEDYYRLAAVFTTTIRSEIDLPSATRRASRRRFRSPPRATRTPSTTPTTAASPTSTPRRTSLRRGDVTRRGPRPTPGYLRVLSGGGSDGSGLEGRAAPGAGPARSYRRASLGAWLTDTDVRRRAARRAGDRQPALATPLRPRDRRHAQRFRRQGEPAVPPRAARLAGRRPRRERLAAQAIAQADRDQRRLHAGQPVRRGPREDRPRERVPLATRPAPARGRADPRRHARGRRPARRRRCSAPARSTRRCRAGASISSSSEASSSR